MPDRRARIEAEQGFGRVADPLEVRFLAKDIVGLTLRSLVLRVLLDDRYLLNQLQLTLGITERFAQRREITVDGSLGDRGSFAAPRSCHVSGPRF